MHKSQITNKVGYNYEIIIISRYYSEDIIIINGYYSTFIIRKYKHISHSSNEMFLFLYQRSPERHKLMDV